jgi:predicted nucleotidyltransferase
MKVSTLVNDLEVAVTALHKRHKGFTGLILFGSTTRRTVIRPTSDVDLLIYFRESHHGDTVRVHDTIRDYLVKTIGDKCQLTMDIWGPIDYHNVWDWFGKAMHDGKPMIDRYKLIFLDNRHERLLASKVNQYRLREKLHCN